MTSREGFEASYTKGMVEGQRLSELRQDDSGYVYPNTQWAYNIWQAAERDMLERAIAKFHNGFDGCAFSHIEVQDILKELLND